MNYVYHPNWTGSLLPKRIDTEGGNCTVNSAYKYGTWGWCNKTLDLDYGWSSQWYSWWWG